MLQYLIAFSLVSGPILMLYGWGMWNFQILLSLVCIILWFVYNKRNPFFVPKHYSPFLVLFLLFSSFWNGLGGLPLGIIMFMAFILFYAKSLDINTLIKIYRVIALINVVIFLFQTLGMLSFSGILNFLPISGKYYEDTSMIELSRFYAVRKAGMFGEPAHFVQFLLPLVCLEAFYNNDKYHWTYLAIFVITLFFLKSGNGYVGFLVFALFFAFRYLKSKKNFFKFGLFVIVAIVGTYYFMSSSLGASMIERSSELSRDQTDFSSGYVRIWLGYDVYNGLSIVHKLFGASSSHIAKESMGSLIPGRSVMYFNTVQYFLVYTGFIGLLSFGYFIFKEMRKTDYAGKCILSIYVILSFMSSMYFSYMTIFYLAIPLVLSHRKYLKA